MRLRRPLDQNGSKEPFHRSSAANETANSNEFEFRLNVELWKHDDAMRQAHNQTFLAANSAALVAAGLIVSASDRLSVRATTGIVAAVFGIAVCGVWLVVQARHNAYIRFHRCKLVSLEAGLNSSTFGEQDRGFHQGQPVEFGKDALFALSPFERHSSSKAEALLPAILGLLWLIGGAACVGALVAS